MKDQKRQYFNKFTNEIYFLRILYYLNFPLAKILADFKIKPNYITTFSNFLAILGLMCLLLFHTPVWFAIFWFLSLCFDICDGLVARLNNLSSNFGAFYDHVSDMIKIILLFAVVGIKYNNFYIWVLCFFAASLMMLYDSLNNKASYVDLLANNEKDLIKNTEEVNCQNKKKIIRRLLASNKTIKRIILFIISNFFVIQGHMMIYFIFLGFGKKIALIILGYFILVILRNLIHVLNYLKKSYYS